MECTPIQLAEALLSKLSLEDDLRRYDVFVLYRAYDHR